MHVEWKMVEVMERRCNMLALPNEILLHIFQFLGPGDILSVIKSCVRFNEVFCEKRLVRNVDFKINYSFEVKELKYFLTPKLRCKNIRSLDLTSCYWLPAPDIVSSVLKLKELQQLYVADTKFTFSHLNKISPILPNLRRLSLSGDAKSLSEKPTIASSLSSLESLHVCLRVVTPSERASTTTSSLVRLSHWLPHFSGLQELQVDGRCNCTDRSWLIRSPSLPLLRSFSFNVQCHIQMANQFRHKILDQVPATTKWHHLWYGEALDTNTPWTFYPSHSWNHLYDSKKLSWISGDFPHGVYPHLTHLHIVPQFNFTFSDEHIMTSLTHLNISYSSIDWNVHSWFETFKGLHTLSLKLSHIHEVFEFGRQNDTLAEKVTNLRSLSLFVEKTRMLGSRASMLVVGMKSLVHAFPLVSEFRLELESTECSTKENTEDWRKEFLPLVPTWTRLRKLVLINAQVNQGNFLTKMGDLCPSLESLHIVDYHMPISCQYFSQLIRALPRWGNLKHFRLDHSDFGQLDALLGAFQGCRLLESVVLMKRGSFGRPCDSVDSVAMANFVTKAKQLVFLVVSLASATDVWHKQTAKMLAARVSHRHPFFSRISKGFSLTDDEIPWVHCNTMFFC